MPLPAPNPASTITYSERVLGGLLAAAAAFVQGKAANARAVAEVLLHHPPPGTAAEHPHSDLNVTGSPLQLLLSARPACWEARLIGDPAFYEPDPLERWRKSLSALQATLVGRGADGLQQAVRSTLDAVIPADEIALRRYPTGMIRLAAALTSRGAAMYAGAPHGVDRWDVASAWAAAVLRSARTAQEAIGRLEGHAAVFGMGVEGASAASARAKLYWRLRRSAPVSAFELPWLSSPTVTRFLGAVLGRASVPLDAITFSAAFNVVDGGLMDVKADVCIAQAGLDLRGALCCVNEQAALLGLSPPALDGCVDTLERNNVGIGCLGLGRDNQGAHRLNVYLYQQGPAPLGH